MTRERNAREPGVGATLMRELVAGDRHALARAITIVENDAPGADALLREVQACAGQPTIVGITGSPGVGKSTLIDALIAELRRRGRTVAVVAVDPSSPFSRGAILGDRIRMGRHVDDAGVFVRSIASRGEPGGLARTADRVIRVMAAARPDWILVETVGAGQGDVRIAQVAPLNVVVNAPGMGDDVQAIKAGILEIADILVVNKCDLPGADRTVRELEAMVHLRRNGLPAVPVLATTATRGIGLAQLVDAIDERTSGCTTREGPGLRVALADQAAALVRDRILSGDDPAIGATCARVESGELTPTDAAAALVGIVAGQCPAAGPTR